MQKSTVFDWNLDYLSGRTPWETGQPAPELVRAVDLGLIAPSSAFEMGCGTGQNAVYLARRGFQVTAADCSSIALARARLLAKESKTKIGFLEVDLCNFTEEVEPVDFVFDRSCYEYLCHTQRAREGYIRTLLRITRIGSKFLLIVRRSRKNQGKVFQVDRLLTELGHQFLFDELGSAKLRASGERSIRRAFLMTRQAAP